MKQTKSLLGIIAGIFAVAFVMASCETQVSIPNYTVTYTSVDYGTAPEPITVKENTVLSAEQLPELSDDAAVFKGWFDGDTKAVPGEYQVKGNVELTAHWSQLATITYHSKFGTVPESFELERNQTLTSEKVAPMSSSPYTFLGWFDSEDDDHNGTGEQINAGLTITNNTDLYAKWKTATVSFTTQYGTNPASIKKYTGEKISETEIPALTARTGYTSDGWFNGSTKLTTDYTVNGDVAFTEKWTVNTYLITFKANGGAESDSTQSVTYGSTVKLSANTFTRDGWSFIGWNEAANGSGTSYPDESNFAVTDANDITLYAQWDPNATASTVADMIKSMTESGTIAVKGSISDDTISNINYALGDLWRRKGSNVHVSLDLSRTTGITELKASAFRDMYLGYYRGLENLKDITIPSGVTSIGESAFYGCSGLTSITIPSGVTSIGESAFYGCSGLTGSITIPSSVTSIGSYAFDGCSSLTSITIPSSVTEIGQGVFRNCSSLTSVTIPNSVTSIRHQAFFGCSSLTSITIPSSVTSILSSAFSGCSSLTSITIPSSVRSIRSNTFDGCSSLTSITIPSSVIQIGDHVFRNCSSLTSVTIPSGVRSIRSNTFDGCSSLTSITIPSSVTSILSSAFSGCSKLTDVTFADTESSWDYYDDSGTKQGTIGKMSATDTAGNATLLTSLYENYEWRKQQ